MQLPSSTHKEVELELFEAYALLEMHFPASAMTMAVHLTLAHTGARNEYCAAAALSQG